MHTPPCLADVHLGRLHALLHVILHALHAPLHALDHHACRAWCLHFRGVLFSGTWVFRASPFIANSFKIDFRRIFANVCQMYTLVRRIRRPSRLPLQPRVPWPRWGHMHPVRRRKLLSRGDHRSDAVPAKRGIQSWGAQHQYMLLQQWVSGLDPSKRVHFLFLVSMHQRAVQDRLHGRGWCP